MKNIKPSELITLGLHDLEIVEKMPDKYTIDMSNWLIHRQGHQGDRCFVCFAGAVMAISLNRAHQQYVIPQCLPPEQEKLMLALNRFREGNIQEGLEHMDIEVPEGCRIWWDAPGYENNPSWFKESMKALAEHLEKFNL